MKTAMVNFTTWVFTPLRFCVRYHVLGSLSIVLFASAMIAIQVSDRFGFANSELYQDVMARWGAPIDQAAPSVRYVQSGAVFNTLKPLPLSSQHIHIAAAMNFRKRGLVYFSGFDFVFQGDYAIANPQAHEIDIVFVFPVSLDRNKVLLSELEFSVNGEPAAAELSAKDSRLMWTGRLPSGGEAQFRVRFKGRGLNRFNYRLDPDLPARDVRFTVDITGGDNYDYPHGVVPAHQIEQTEQSMNLAWHFPALESGVPVGVVLPSEKSFDELIITMATRSWAPFLAFYAGFMALTLQRQRRIAFYESYLLAAGYGFFFVLLAYLAAFMDFYLAYALSALVIMGLLSLFASRLLSGDLFKLIGLLLAFLVVPSMAVLLQGYTGLIYTLEILSGLMVIMWLASRQDFADFMQRVIQLEEVSGHA